MSTCNISIPFTQTPDQLITKAKSTITGAGGTFEGDATDGDFQLSTPIGAVKGSYTINNSIIEITITDKPIFVSCKRIEEELRNRLS